jgi:hypothetical protein
MFNRSHGAMAQSMILLHCQRCNASIIHAEGENGFVPNALLMCKSHQATGDYNHQMNQQNYEKCVREKAVPKFSPNSVVVLDNTPYHTVTIKKFRVPTQSNNT